MGGGGLGNKKCNLWEPLWGSAQGKRKRGKPKETWRATLRDDPKYLIGRCDSASKSSDRVKTPCCPLPHEGQEELTLWGSIRD